MFVWRSLLVVLSLFFSTVFSTDWITDARTGKEYMTGSSNYGLLHVANQRQCHRFYAHLPEPRDEIENRFLNSLGTSAFALGMSDTGTEGQWRWDSDGSLVTWTNWLPGEPNGGRRENCGMVMRQMGSHKPNHRADAWNDVPCPGHPVLRRSVATTLICERDIYWVHHRSSNKMYVKLNTTVNSAENAARICHNVGGILPEPRNSEENYFVSTIMGRVGWFFLGLTDNDADGQWVWSSDGSPVRWTFWRSGEPAGGRYQNCAIQPYFRVNHVWHARWTSKFCNGHSSNNVPVVCQRV